LYHVIPYLRKGGGGGQEQLRQQQVPHVKYGTVHQFLK
jgi:hypothetical protein